MSRVDDKLVRMAEQIGANCSMSSDPEVVANRLADHINRFWDPRMRASIVRYVDQQQLTVSPALQLALARINVPVS